MSTTKATSDGRTHTNRVPTLATRFIDSGVKHDMSASDARYVRFLNATLLLFALGQAPVLFLLISLNLWVQLQINVAALAVLGLGYVLNRRGHHLVAKVLVIAVVTSNTAYFTAMFGSDAPTHLWLIPGAVLGVLVFKPSEWVWTLLLVGTTMVCFSTFEFVHHSLEPVVRHLADAESKLRAGQGSTIAAMVLTLILIGMMHLRFARSEAALSQEKAESDRLLRAILPDEIADELRETGTTQAVRHEDVSLLFADIVH